MLDVPVPIRHTTLSDGSKHLEYAVAASSDIQKQSIDVVTDSIRLLVRYGYLKRTGPGDNGCRHKFEPTGKKP